MPPEDASQFLAGSTDRQRLLRHIADCPESPAQLAAALSLSRRSVQRHLRQFVDRGWAEKVDGAYQLTMTGTLVLAEHTTYLDALDRIETFRPFFRHLPDQDHLPDPRWLDTATLSVASAENPQAPVQHYLDSVREFGTGRIRMLSPVLNRMFHNAHAELAMKGAHTELVMASTTIERARELNPIEFELVVSVGVLDVYRLPEALVFGLTLGDERLLMGAYDDDGQLRACVESSHRAFLQWAERLFERYRGRSEVVDPSFPVS